MEYQGYSSLPVTLNRQKYGPLDVSNVFIGMDDFNYYRSKKKINNNVSDYWKNIVPYPYEGQIISIIDNNNILTVRLTSCENDIFNYETVITQSILDNTINNFNETINNVNETIENLNEVIENSIELIDTRVDTLESKMFVCVTQEQYNQLIDEKEIDAYTPYLIIDPPKEESD